ncbi:MAG TPA: hypothetical protein VK891_18085 [Euzebyales bacterium]|nr:hypothetical protein [Euzebyales bacterium]
MRRTISLSIVMLTLLLLTAIVLIYDGATVRQVEGAPQFDEY